MARWIIGLDRDERTHFENRKQSFGLTGFAVIITRLFVGPAVTLKGNGGATSGKSAGLLGLIPSRYSGRFHANRHGHAASIGHL